MKKALKYAVYSDAWLALVSTHASASAAGRAAKKVLRPQLYERHSRPGPLVLRRCYPMCADELARRDFELAMNTGEEKQS